MKRLILPIILMTALLTGCGEEVIPESAAENNTPVLNADDEAALLTDAQAYADAEGVTVDEAIRRFELTTEMGDLKALIVENEESYAGSWIQHQPEYRYIFAFTENSEEIIRKYVEEDSPLADKIEVRTFEVSYKELKAAQEATMALAEDIGLDFYCATSIDIKENTAVIYITNSDLFNQILSEAGVTLPDHVTQVSHWEPPETLPFDINPPEPPVHFPQLLMHSGACSGLGITGTLHLDNGYLYIGKCLIVWEPGYYLTSSNGTIEVLDQTGNVVAREGEEVYIDSVLYPFENGTSDYLNGIFGEVISEPLPGDEMGPFLIQGNSVKLNLNYASDIFTINTLQHQDHEFRYFTVREPLAEKAGQGKEYKVSLYAGSEYRFFQYPYLTVWVNGDYEMQCTVLWPEGYTARVTEGIFEIIDTDGAVVIRDGEEALIEGVVFEGINSEVSSQLYAELPEGPHQPYLVITSTGNEDHE